MHQLTIISLAQIMICRLFGTEPLSKPMMVYLELESTLKEISMKFKHKYNTHARKWINEVKTFLYFNIWETEQLTTILQPSIQTRMTDDRLVSVSATPHPDHIFMIALNCSSRVRKHLRNQYEDSITSSTYKQHFVCTMLRGVEFG